MSDNKQTRRYDIDWLRTLALGVLILYHIGMYYVADWGWHIKSTETSQLLQNFMMITNPWRMSLLFFIAAMALALVQQRYSAWQLIKTRTTRLMLPLFFGMFVVVVPQVYFEALSQNLIEPGFFKFWFNYVNPQTNLLKEHHSLIGLLTWNHLWFLPYLWLYSLIFIIFRKPIEHIGKSVWLSKQSNSLIFATVIISLMIIWLVLRESFPPTNDLVNDWYNHGKYFLVFCIGYLFVLQKHWWQFVIDKRHTFLLLAILGYMLLLANHHGMLNEYADTINSNLWVRAFFGMGLSVNHWAWIFCVVGYAGCWLNRPSTILSYTTQAILPWYILHQTLIITFAWWLKSLAIIPALEAIILLTLTIAACFIGYEIIKRVNALRLMCGLKPLHQESNQRTQMIKLS